METYLNIVKTIYNKPIGNIKINGEKLKEKFTKIKNKICLPTQYTIEIELKVLVRAIRQLKEIKEIQVEKEEISFFADNIIMYMFLYII